MSKETDHQPSTLTLEQVAAIAREVLLAQGAHSPLLIVEAPARRLVLPLEGMAPTHESRMEQMLLAGFALGESRKVRRLEQVFFISEGWMSMARDGKAPDQPPSQDPDRKEVLIISRVQVRSGRSDVALYEMIRGKTGDLFELRALDSDDMVEAETPLVDAFVVGFQMGNRPAAL